MPGNKTYMVKKVLNNNAFVALDNDQQEVVLIGKGIGFQRNKGDSVTNDSRIEKVFVLASQGQREQIMRLFDETDEEVVRTITEYVKQAEDDLKQSFSTQFFIALTDHLAFAVKRLQQGIKINNPFLHDIRILYPFEYQLAVKGTAFLEKHFQMEIPEDEIGFLALHLHSGRTNQNVSQMNSFSGLIAKLVKVIETELAIEIDKVSLEYSRLLTHLRFAIERAKAHTPLKKEENSLSSILQKEYYECYNIAWKLVKILQTELSVTIPEAEVGYLTIHIQRIVDRTKAG